MYLFLNEYDQNCTRFEDMLINSLQLNEENNQSDANLIKAALEENSDLSEESYTIDYFSEYIKPFIKKKSKVGYYTIYYLSL